MDRHTTSPFMLRLFYRTGAFHRPDEFNVGTHTDNLPPHLTLHVWPDCTLTELSHHIACASSSSLPSTSAAGQSGRPPHHGTKLLPDPAIGTRLVFRLIFADFRATGQANGRPSEGPSVSDKFKDLGSVVIGEGGQGLDISDLDGLEDPIGSNGEVDVAAKGALQVGSDGSKTLSEARFVAGDYISCAILPPLEDGSVTPASSARTGRGFGPGEARAVGGGVGPPPSGSRGYGRYRAGGSDGDRGGGRTRGWERDRGRDGDRYGGGDEYGARYGEGRRRGRGGSDYGGAGDGGRRYRDRGESDRGVPSGEWRRGEALPAMPRGDWRRGEDLHGHDAQSSKERGDRRW